MSILNQEDEFNVFPCPGCRRPISSNVDTCPYCSLPISVEMRLEAIEGFQEENRSHDVEFHRNIALVGVVIFLAGVGLLAMSIVNIYSGTGGFFIWSPILAVIGFGQIIYGLVTYMLNQHRFDW